MNAIDGSASSNSLLRLIADDLPALISYIDARTRYQFVNRAYQSWFGWPRENIIGRTMEEVLGAPAWAALRPHVERVLAGQPVSYEAEVPYQAGGTRWIAATYIPHRDDAGQVVGFVVMVTDVTERRRLEQERARLLASEQAARAEIERQRNSLHTLLMQVPAAIAIVRAPDLRYVLSNQANQRLVGDAQLVGRTVSEALPELDAQGLVDVIRQVLQTGERFVANEMPIRVGGKDPMYLTGTYEPLRGPDNRIDGVMAFAYEVTDQVRSRRRAEEAEERLRLAVEAADVGTWDYYPQTRQLECDARYKALFGLAADAEVSAALLAEAIHPEDRNRVNAAVARAFDPAGDGLYEIDYRVRGIGDGLDRWIEMRGRARFDEAGKPIRFLGTGRDMSEQRRAAERNHFLAHASAILGSSLDYRATLRQIVELAIPQLGDGCAVEMLDDEGQLEQLAVTHQDPGGLVLAQQLRRRYPPARDSASVFYRVLETRKPLFVPDVLEEDVARAASDPEHLRLLQQLGLRSVILVPLQVRERALGVLALVISRPGRRYTGEDLALAEELARRASAAVENARLYQAAEVAIQKRDDFVSIASHELRTPLSSLGLYLASCLRELRRSGAQVDAAKLQGRLERASDQLDRLTRLVDDLLDVSRISAGRLELARSEMNLGELARDVLGRLSEQAAKVGSTLDLQVEGEVVGEWDRPRLDEVLTNLVVNAIKFGAGKPVRVTVSALPGAEGREARLVVADQGPGVRPEDRERVFERFERTAEARNVGGIGLGLWIARQIVRAHQGDIRVEGDPGQGARFVVQLPDRRSAGTRPAQSPTAQ